MILKFNSEIEVSLAEQNNQVEQLFKDYVVLGIVPPDNGEVIIGEPMKRETFRDSMFQENQIFLDKKEKLADKSDKFEAKKIIENQITKMFDLIDKRWVTILALLNLWREERAESYEKSLKLMPEYLALENSMSESDEWHKRAEHIFKNQIEILDYQEKRFSKQDEALNELRGLLELRGNLLKEADEVSLA